MKNLPRRLTVAIRPLTWSKTKLSSSTYSKANSQDRLMIITIFLALPHSGHCQNLCCDSNNNPDWKFQLHMLDLIAITIRLQLLLNNDLLHPLISQYFWQPLNYPVK